MPLRSSRVFVMRVVPCATLVAIVTTGSRGLHQVCERIEPDGNTVDRHPGNPATEMAVKQAG
jgi:hypothetical protein